MPCPSTQTCPAPRPAQNLATVPPRVMLDGKSSSFWSSASLFPEIFVRKHTLVPGGNKALHSLKPTIK